MPGQNRAGIVSAMRRLFFAALVLAAACKAPPSQTRPAQPGVKTEMKTIDSADIRPAQMDPPPLLTGEDLKVVGRQKRKGRAWGAACFGKSAETWMFQRFRRTRRRHSLLRRQRRRLARVVVRELPRP